MIDFPMPITTRTHASVQCTPYSFGMMVEDAVSCGVRDACAPDTVRESVRFMPADSVPRVYDRCLGATPVAAPSARLLMGAASLSGELRCGVLISLAMQWQQCA